MSIQLPTNVLFQPGSGSAFAPTPSQQALWLDCQGGARSLAYNGSFGLTFADRIDPKHVTHACRQLVRRQPALRSAFLFDGDDLVVRLLAADAAEPRVDVVAPTAESDGDGTPDRYRAALRAVNAQPFDLECPPLIRFAVVDCDRTTVLCCVHHLAADGVSERWLRDGLARAVFSARSAHDATAAEEAVAEGAAADERYRAAIVAEGARQQQACARGRDYVRQFVQRLPEEMRLPQPPGGAAGTASGGEIGFALDPDLTTRVRQYVTARRTSAFTFWLTVFGRVLAEWGNGSALVGVAASTRAADTAGLAGYFINLVPVLFDLSSADFDGLLTRVHEARHDAMRHRRLPIAEFFQAARAARRGTRVLTGVSMAYRTNPDDRDSVSGIAESMSLLPYAAAAAPLFLRLLEQGDRVRGLIEYDATVDQAAARYASRRLVELGREVLNRNYRGSVPPAGPGFGAPSLRDR